MTPSKATSAIALAGNALKKHGTKPLQYPLHPLSLHTVFAASLHLGNLRSEPNGSVMIRCLTTSEGYDVSQNIWADRPPAQKLIAGAEREVWLFKKRVKTS